MNVKYNGNEFALFAEDYTRNWTIYYGDNAGKGVEYYDVAMSLTCQLVGLIDEDGNEQVPIMAWIYLELLEGEADLMKLVNEDILTRCDSVSEQSLDSDYIEFCVTSCEDDAIFVIRELFNGIKRMEEAE